MDKLIHISKITIPTRARIDYGDIHDLARKIRSTNGLKFNFITVEETSDGYSLLAGGRRLEAHKLLIQGDKDAWEKEDITEEEKLKYSEIPCTVLKDLTEEDRIQIEFVENMSRKDFTWPEAASLVQAYHSLMQKKYGVATAGKNKSGWGTRDTGQALGLNMADVVYYLKLHEGLAKDPSLVNIKQKSKAITKLKRNNQAMIADLLKIEGYSVNDVQIICADSKEYLPGLEENLVDMVITDPPWGIDFEERLSTMRTDSIHGEYDKGYDPMDTLAILSQCFRVMKPNTPIYLFYSSFPEKVQEAMKLLSMAGFNVEQIPLIWYKKHIIAHNSQESKHGYNYETIIYGWKGERPFFNTSSRNVFEHQIAFGSGRIHSSEKPEALLVELIKLHTQEKSLVLDPFGGSCKVADACKNTLRKSIVIEKDSELVKLATLRVRGL